MAANDPATYVDTPGGRMQAAALFYWNGSAWAASSGGGRTINTPVASVGNGADLTEDTLQSFTIPANTLRNVGDRIQIVASGTMGATTDTKTARIRLAGVIYGAATGTTAVGVTWIVTVNVQKTGSNTQIGAAFGAAQQQVSNVSSVVGSLTDTATIALTVTGQNTTNSVAGSVVCRFLTVDYIPA